MCLISTLLFTQVLHIVSCKLRYPWLYFVEEAKDAQGRMIERLLAVLWNCVCAGRGAWGREMWKYWNIVDTHWLGFTHVTWDSRQQVCVCCVDAGGGTPGDVWNCRPCAFQQDVQQIQNRKEDPWAQPRPGPWVQAQAWLAFPYSFWQFQGCCDQFGY